MTWQWFHRLGSPRWFYEKSGNWLPWLTAVTALLLVVGSIWGLAFAPADAKQGNSYRIIYIHMPTAVVSLAGYYVMAISGAVGLIWRMKLAYMMMKSAAIVGAMLTFLALFTGAVWGKPTWGTWWVWDARTAFMVLMLFLYLGVIALQEAYQSHDTATKASAILALVGTVNIPIIYKSVDWWYTLHQPATIKFTSESTIHPSMLYPLLTMIAGVYCLYTVALILYTRAEVLQREKRTKWVQQLVTGAGEAR
ncbi:heme ABC transporter permease [Exilibacterium tricleocarpae]|uniref:Heme exporter protein C n=1 Tax=Exilibacterium tricleocarpae TaxID=2591008 RepID=A0A545TLY8_9GAMM|nr:heme ABC transporter permease CcmC [Exilibacterium tricleocarpae]TQV78243.1 heme ABC transporter permease [Exilibacterium tricleocarpae]